MHSSSSQTTRETLPETISLGAVRLRVADLERSLGFYRDVLGYAVREVDRGLAALSPEGDDGGLPHFELRETPGAARSSRQSPGLYHAAILLPTRADLARVTVLLHQSGIPFGHSDHGVSEALYLDDPDGHGLEIYADRPRDAWPLSDEGVAMTLDPLDFESLLSEITKLEDVWGGVPSGTQIGHVHLRTSDLDAAYQFYIDALGFETMMTAIPGALFIAVGGYHHHIGLNVWESRGGSMTDESHAGLDQFVIQLPEASALEPLAGRLEEHGIDFQRESDRSSLVIHDPDGIRIRVSG